MMPHTPCTSISPGCAHRSISPRTSCICFSPCIARNRTPVDGRGCGFFGRGQVWAQPPSSTSTTDAADNAIERGE
eukprot:3255251-Rhodomonas_salina.2